jgi:hypothetical protein
VAALAEEGSDVGGFFLGLFDIVIGLGILLAGLRMFFAVLPIGAFIVGGYAAGMAVYHLGDEGGFLDTTFSIVVGLAAGAGFAIASYLLWYLGALILAGAVGAMIGSGIMAAFTSDADVLTFLVALAGAVLAVGIAYVLNVPTWVVIVVTSLFGAAVTVLGVMLTLDRVEVEQLEQGPALAVVNHSWFWILGWAALVGVGIWMQYVTTRDIDLPEGRWSRLQPETYARVDRRRSSI